MDDVNNEVVEDQEEIETPDDVDIRADLDAAMESLGVTDDEPTETPAVEEAPQEPETVEAKTDDGRTLEDPAAAYKAPMDWSPQQREEWSKIPTTVQERIHQREKEIADVMANTNTARQSHDSLQQLSSQYSTLMSAEGFNNPVEAVSGIMASVNQLRNGSPQQKAQLVAQMISGYGVDIATLDHLLAGEAPPAQQQSSPQLEQLIDQRMQPVNQLMQALEQVTQAQQQQQNVAAQNQVKEFSQGAEFLNDVRADMADLIDLAAKNGRDLSLQDAYDRACSIHPEISKVVAQRQQTATLLGNQQSIQQKRHAASSVVGRKSGSDSSRDVGIRDAIVSAWDSM